MRRFITRKGRLTCAFSGSAWDNGRTTKDGPAGALTPVIPGLADDWSID